MAHRTTYWRPQPGVEVWLPSINPLGESIRADIYQGRRSALLDDFQAREMFNRLKSTFAGSRVDEAGRLHWKDGDENGFVARCGEQYLDVVSFDLTDEDEDTIFSIAQEYLAQHYDWGN